MLTNRLPAISAILLFSGIFAESCEAGPLLDWLRGRPVVQNFNAYRQHAFYRGQVNPPVSPAAQMPGTCMTTCPKTCYQTVNRVVANYVPYTAFRTQWYRVPVTYYRPVTTTNPQTGCISTCMKPCTYYQMQARRVPYTTYQTVYRTVQQRVPYTVYETSYSGNNCGSCTSCGTPPAAGTAPVTSGIVQNQAPAGVNIGGQYDVPANTVPQLNSSDIKQDTTLQKPANETPVPEPDPMPSAENPAQNSSHQAPGLNLPENAAPVVSHGNRTAKLIRGQWNYSPVRSAGYLTSMEREGKLQKQDSRKSMPSKTAIQAPAFRSGGWKSISGQ